MDPRSLELNRASWDERAPIHAASAMYDLDAFRRDPRHLSGVVAFDRHAVGDVAGRSLVHLQCHIGTDTLSWARLGATVTGLDLSGSSLEHARRLFAETDTRGRFVQAEVHDAVDALGGERFDVVYTGVGALNWLPDIRRWAHVVVALLAPGGLLHLREGHPMLGALDEHRSPELVVRYPYFETVEPLVFDEPGTYTDPDAHIEHRTTHEWQHGIGEVVTALLDVGLTLTSLREHRFLEWQAHPHMVLTPEGTYVLPEPQRDLVPLMYSLTARAPA
jgi:SAM-dependent methyltransferase